jgi:hypothetical protein
MILSSSYTRLVWTDVLVIHSEACSDVRRPLDSIRISAVVSTYARARTLPNGHPIQHHLLHPFRPAIPPMPILSSCRSLLSSPLPIFNPLIPLPSQTADSHIPISSHTHLTSHLRLSIPTYTKSIPQLHHTLSASTPPAAYEEQETGTLSLRTPTPRPSLLSNTSSILSPPHYGCSYPQRKLSSLPLILSLPSCPLQTCLPAEHLPTPHHPTGHSCWAMNRLG